MAKLNLEIDDVVMDNIRTRLGLETNKQAIEEALTLINWAAGEKAAGRVILSAAQDGTQVNRLAMECLRTESSRSAGSATRDTEALLTLHMVLVGNLETAAREWQLESGAKTMGRLKQARAMVEESAKRLLGIA